jgi:zinc transport system substrate-binding protein
MIVMLIRGVLALLSAATLVALAGCGSGDDGAGGEGKLEVVAAFYPLQYAVEQIGGGDVAVTGLTKPGVEPHDLELSARAVAGVAGADALVYLRGFQSAVDDAVDTQANDGVLDVSKAARLHLAAAPDEHAGESAAEHEEHADEGAGDPHFWLDPKRYADVADAIAEHLSSQDSAHAADYQARARNFTARLAALDAEFAAGLRHCQSRELVTSHAAFGYLAEAYDLHQVGITGLTPESEPSPAALARIASFVRDEGVRTIYAETLVSREVAETLARETGAKLAVLDPIEGLTDQSAGDDYFQVMRANLKTLQAGQGCR